MAVVRVVEVALDQVITVIAVRHARMSAAGAVDMIGGVAGAAVVRRALRRVGRVDRDRVLVDVIAVDAVQVSIVEIVDVAGVLDREVAAVGAVNVIVAWVDRVGHEISCWAGVRRSMAGGGMVRRDPQGKLGRGRTAVGSRTDHVQDPALCLARTRVMRAHLGDRARPGRARRLIR